MRRISNWLLVLAIIGAAVGAAVPLATPQPVMAMTGSGTSGDPWIIMDIDDLQAIGTGSYALSHYYELGGDIDASATSGWNGGAGFEPLGTFTGSLDGNYHTITGLYINRSSSASSALNIGLFTSLNGATVKNLHIVNASMTGEHQTSGQQCNGGILAATAGGSNLLVQNILVHGTLALTAKKTNTPRLHSYGGGLIGYLYCSSPAVVERCAAFVNVSGYSSGNYALYNTGGLIGHQQGTVTTRNCYARGSVYTQISYGAASAGGLTGRTWGTTYIQNSYATGAVSGGASTKKGGLNGLIAYPGSQITNSFWDTQTTGQPASDGGTGKSTAEMTTTATFTSAGWDFDTVWDRGGYVNDGYPYFDWWYDPADMIDDLYHVVWFQPNAIIEGTTLPNRTGNEDGIFSWGANPAGITITHSMLAPEKDFHFEPFLPPSLDIIDPEPAGMSGDVNLDRLQNNPLRPLVQVISSTGDITERLAWLGLAILVLIAMMVYVQLKTTHIVFTSLAGLGVAASFYVMGVFPWWVPILLVFGLVGSIIYERMPVL